MKKLTFALSLLAVLVTATGAHAVQHLQPAFNHQFRCLYSPSTWTNEVQWGWSIFTSPRPINSGLIYATEVYQSTITQGYDNRHIAFAKPKSYCGSDDPYCDEPNAMALSTTWEFTITNGVQCTKAKVFGGDQYIEFSGCSNGKVRTCAF